MSSCGLAADLKSHFSGLWLHGQRGHTHCVLLTVVGGFFLQSATLWDLEEVIFVAMYLLYEL